MLKIFLMGITSVIIMYTYTTTTFNTLENINLDYIRPNIKKCNGGSTLYCYGGFKHERDMTILYQCAKAMRYAGEQKNTRFWEQYETLTTNGNYNLNYDIVGNSIDNTKIILHQSPDYIGTNINPCLYILNALKYIDNNNNMYVPGHFKNRYEELNLGSLNNKYNLETTYNPGEKHNELIKKLRGKGWIDTNNINKLVEEKFDDKIDPI